MASEISFFATREAFLQLDKIPARLKLWAEDRELEEYIRTGAFVANAKTTLPAAKGIKIAVIGSGPAGLGAADELCQLGFSVTVFEQADRPGGLLIYGVPNVKLSKDLLTEKLQDLQNKGVEFRLQTKVGGDVALAVLEKEFASVIVCAGSTAERQLKIPGAEAKGVIYAREYLSSLTRSLLEENFNKGAAAEATGKNVLIIGGGDTGTDCSGMALAQGAKTILQVETQDCILARTSEEGFCDIVQGDATLQYNTRVLRLLTDDSGQLKAAELCRVVWTLSDSGMPKAQEIEGSKQEIPVDLAIVAIGFTGPEAELVNQFGLRKTPLGTIATSPGSFATNLPGVFAAGDARRGGGMVEWAFAEGRDAATECAKYAVGK